MRYLLKGGDVVGRQVIKKDILIDHGVIEAIDNDIEDDDATIIDCEGYTIAPGFIDMHVHLREPGYEHKETIKTGTQAAARGGFTTICPMPNTNPVMDSFEKLHAFMKKVETDAVVNVLPFAAITKELKENQELVDMKALKKMVAGFSNDGLGLQKASLMYHAMQRANEIEALISAHCEDESLLFGGYVHRGIKSQQNEWESMTALPESIQVARDVLISEETDARYHVCHISTKESIRIVRDAKKRGLKVTSEVTPHHILLVNHDVENENFKMNPPLRNVDDKYALIQALLDGTIDCIATDHAPHAESEKKRGMKEAPFGVVGLETAFPLIYTNLVRTNMATLTQAIQWFSINPAKILNVDLGYIVKNRQADLTILDLNRKQRINKNVFYSKGKNTPFDGWEAYGFPVMTFVRGKVVYHDETFNRY